LAALEHFRVVGELGDRGRRDQEDFRRPGVRALSIDTSKKDKAARAFGDVESGNGKPLLQVVAAKREDHEVDRRMAHEAGWEGIRAAAIRVGRIVVDRRAAVEPLGDHLEVRPKLALQDAGPALRARKTVAGGGIVTPGVGIAEGDDDRHRLKLSLRTGKNDIGPRARLAYRPGVRHATRPWCGGGSPAAPSMAALSECSGRRRRTPVRANLQTEDQEARVSRRWRSRQATGIPGRFRDSAAIRNSER